MAAASEHPAPPRSRMVPPRKRFSRPMRRVRIGWKRAVRLGRRVSRRLGDVSAKAWLSWLLLILALPILGNLFVPRQTAFRVVTETQSLTAALMPTPGTDRLKILLRDAVICADEGVSGDNMDADTALCPGFGVGREGVEGYAAVRAPSLLQVSRRQDLVVVTLMPEPGTSSGAPCDRPTAEIVRASRSLVSDEDLLIFLDDTEPDDAVTTLCGVVRFELERSAVPRGAWLILDGRDLVLGSDSAPIASTAIPTLLGGTVELYGVGFFSDVGRLFRSTLAPQSGFLRLSEFELNFGDAIRFPSVERKVSEFYLTAGVLEDGLRVSAWVISSEAVVSAYGSPGYVLRPTVLDRFVNDPLLNYWVALTAALLSLWIRATLSESMMDKNIIDGL